jgi:voltage-gated potassium channel
VKRSENLRLGQIAVTIGLISLISLAVGTHLVYGLIILATVAAGVGVFYVVFPGSRFFAIAFANSLAVYSCIYIFFVEANFEAVDPVWRQIGFTMPIMAFVGGAAFRRAQIRRLLDRPLETGKRHFGRVLLWLLPVVVIGASTFPLAELFPSAGGLTTVFFVSMGLTSSIVLWVSRDVCAFLLETGLVFEDFFRRIAGLAIPSFAFFTFYSVIVIVFAAIYRIIDRYAAGTHFLFAGEPRDVSFIECLYFSIITLSTVGYGDLIPLSPAVRLIVSVEILCGLLLLLFGFSEIISYTRQQTKRPE